MKNVITLGKLIGLLLLFCLPLLLLLSINVHTKKIKGMSSLGTIFLVMGFFGSCPQTPLASDGMVQGAGVATPCTVYILWGRKVNKDF